MNRHVVVVGGGLGGLAAAVELRSRGWRVTLVERSSHLGGKMNVLQERGYSFDMGPTILTMPQVARGIIERTGRRVEDFIEFVRLDPQWRCFYEDGLRLDLRQDLAAMAQEIERVTGAVGEGERYRRFIEYSRRMLRLSEKVFFYKDLGGIMDVIRRPPPKEPGVLRDVLAMRLHSTMAATVHRTIREPHVRQMVEHFLQYVGSSPFLAPSILTLIAAAQVDHGCWYARGGTRSVARALERILREEQTEIVLGTGVRSIIADGPRVQGVLLDDGRAIMADAVVSNADVQRTYRDLLGEGRSVAAQRRIARQYRPACSGLVLYLGLKRRYDELLHHNFMFSADGRREFDDLYGRGVPARDPTLYVCAPSRSDETQAPPGCEALYILIHAPALRDGQRWRGPGGILESYRGVVIDKLRRHGLRDIESQIEVERSLVPEDIERIYGSEGGAIYGLASHGKIHGGFKPANRSRVMRGLYFCGGTVNPGPGVPMVLMGGVTAADALCEDMGESPRRSSASAVEARATESEPWASVAAS